MEQIKERYPNSNDAHNELAKQEEHKLTTEQLYMYAYQMYTSNSTMYPYVESAPQVVDGDVAAVLYQGDLYELEDFGGLNVEKVVIRQNNAASQTVLDIQTFDGKDGFKYTFDYAASRYEEKAMSDFKDLFKCTVASILHNVNADVYTFDQLKRDVCGKKGFAQKIKGIFSKNK